MSQSCEYQLLGISYGTHLSRLAGRESELPQPGLCLWRLQWQKIYQDTLSRFADRPFRSFVQPEEASLEGSFSVECRRPSCGGFNRCRASHNQRLGAEPS